MRATITRQNITGAAELERALRDLGNPKTATRIGVNADRAAARALRARMIETAPYDPKDKNRGPGKNYGHLRDNIKIRRAKSRKETAVVFYVTTGSAFWGSFQENGTVNQPPYPWMRPAFDSAAAGLVTVQADSIRAGLDREAKKARRLGLKGV